MKRRVKGLRPTRTEARYRGAMHTRQLSNDRLIMAKWPRKRPGAGPPILIAYQQIARWVFKATTYSTPEEVAMAQDMSQGTMYLPRDLLGMAMYGTLVEIRDKTGQRWWSERQVATEIQAMLDQITQTVGSILVRGADGWIGYAPTASGNVLTSKGPGLIPQWEPPSAPPASGAGGYWMFPNRQDDGGDGNSTKGTRWTFAGPALLNAGCWYYKAVAGQTFVATIFRAVGSTLGEELYRSGTITAAATGYATHNYQFDVPPAIAAGEQIYTLMSRTDGGPTEANWLPWGSDWNRPPYWLSGQDYVAKAATAVATGDVVGIAGGAHSTTGFASSPA